MAQPSPPVNDAALVPAEGLDDNSEESRGEDSPLRIVGEYS